MNDDLPPGHAGIDAALASARHEHTRRLTEVLDLNSGLAAILTPGKNAGRSELPASNPAPQASATTSPALPLPEGQAAIIIMTRARARELDRALDRARDRARELGHELDFAHTRPLALDRVVHLKRELALALDRAHDLAIERARDLDVLVLDGTDARVLAFIRDLDSALHLTLAHSRDLCRDLDLDLGRVLSRVLSRAHVRGRSRPRSRPHRAARKCPWHGR